jgi:threonine dehydrogenase-like Zn-dependent dehydrogenase
MKALVYHGPGKIALEERPKPKLQAIGDAIVKITKTTICGTEKHRDATCHQQRTEHRFRRRRKAGVPEASGSRSFQSRPAKSSPHRLAEGIED